MSASVTYCSSARLALETCLRRFGLTFAVGDHGRRDGGGDGHGRGRDIAGNPCVATVVAGRVDVKPKRPETHRLSEG